MTGYRTGAVVSADGTSIGYRRLGSGPGVLLVHGGMQAAQNLMKLAAALADDFTVIVPDRRGRGLSRSAGPAFSVEREVEDLQALLADTGATKVFGLSSGALVALRTAVATTAIDKLALYEPPLSVNGSVPIGWAARYDQEIAAGRLAAALTTVLKGLHFTRLPRVLFVPVLAIGLRLQGRTAGDDVPIADLVPTMAADLQIVRDLADTVQDYTALPADVLLLSGAKSPAYFARTLDALTGVLPRSKRVSFSRVGHTGPEADPGQVADALRTFYA